MADPLGPLALLPGTWTGTGLNCIWRPHNQQPPRERFLEINFTTEKLVFTKINGPIPNRGLLMPDINMFGVTYMQQISDTTTGDGLHIEPGIWAAVPPTSDPDEPATVVRMASIPHGTVVLAQGTTQFLEGGPPDIPANNILPFDIGGQPLPNSQFDQVAQNEFPELDLSHHGQPRQFPPNITQDTIRNPNGILEQAIQGKPMTNRTFIHISTSHNPIGPGGGTHNTAFLSGAADGPNAIATDVEATFWIQTLPGAPGQPDILQLQYTQFVALDFAGLRWPHVTVATLRKQ